MRCWLITGGLGQLQTFPKAVKSSQWILHLLPISFSNSAPLQSAYIGLPSPFLAREILQWHIDDWKAYNAIMANTSNSITPLKYFSFFIFYFILFYVNTVVIIRLNVVWVNKTCMLRFFQKAAVPTNRRGPPFPTAVVSVDHQIAPQAQSEFIRENTIIPLLQGLLDWQAMNWQAGTCIWGTRLTLMFVAWTCTPAISWSQKKLGKLMIRTYYWAINENEQGLF